jgi:hypothetical protein
MTGVIDIERLLPRDATDLHRWLLAAMAAAPNESQLGTLDELPASRHIDALAFAERNLVGPLAAHQILVHWPESPARSQAAAIHEASKRRMTILLRELDDVAARLSGRDIQLVALKNGGIARGIHPCAACCPMGDIDVLISKSRFEEAHSLLESAGFELATRGTVERADLEEGLESGGTEYVKKVDGEEVWFELQWRPIAGRWIRPEQEPSADDLLGRSLAIKGSDARLLSPVDNMLQVCLHTTKHSYVRAPGLRLHTDVDRLTTFIPPDWKHFASTADALRSRTATFLALGLAQSLLETEIPHGLIRDLAPPRWKQRILITWLRRVGIFEPNEPKFSRPEMMGFHALLYDEPRTLIGSVLDADLAESSIRDLPTLAVSGARRTRDLVTRYQR